jgi:protein-S-isoprenylcysteine O-methyltransferase Ste14
MKHVRAILLLPFTMTIVIPGLILYLDGVDPRGLWQSHRPAAIALACVGAAILGAGAWLMAATIRLLAKIGQGTLAPWDPTRRLVVVGVYRRVRNPIMLGVFAVLLGEAMLAASPPLLVWFAAFAALNVVYIPFSEEPGLEKRFGEEYAEYRKNGPRWIPRITPWRGPQERTIA